MDEKARHYQARIEELNRLSKECLEAAAAEQARSIAEQARLAGDEGYTLFFSGEALCLEGDLRGGERLQRQAVARLPDVPFVLTNYAIVLSMLGRLRKALNRLDLALSQDPDDLHALAQMSVTLAKMGRHEEALPGFDRILAADPDNAHALRNKAVSLSRLGREQEALRCLDHVLERNPGDAHAHSERSILLSELRLRGTPLGWLLLWIRKVFLPFCRRLWFRLRWPFSGL